MGFIDFNGLSLQVVTNYYYGMFVQYYIPQVVFVQCTISPLA